MDLNQYASLGLPDLDADGLRSQNGSPSWTLPPSQCNVGVGTLNTPRQAPTATATRTTPTPSSNTTTGVGTTRERSLEDLQSRISSIYIHDEVQATQTPTHTKRTLSYWNWYRKPKKKRCQWKTGVRTGTGAAWVLQLLAPHTGSENYSNRSAERDRQWKITPVRIKLLIMSTSSLFIWFSSHLWHWLGYPATIGWFLRALSQTTVVQETDVLSIQKVQCSLQRTGPTYHGTPSRWTCVDLLTRPTERHWLNSEITREWVWTNIWWVISWPNCQHPEILGVIN